MRSPSRSYGATAMGLAAASAGILAYRRLAAPKLAVCVGGIRPTDENNADIEERNEEARKKAKRTGDLKRFLKQFRALLPIILPGLFSRESAILAAHTVTLIARTFLTVYTRTLDGQIVKQIVDRNPRGFILQILKLLAVAIPATMINSLIRYMESKLALAFRTRMVQHTYKKYMADQTYYRIGNLDSRIANVDQNLTEDVTRFCSGVAHLWSHISKPLLDVVLISTVLVQNNYRKQEKSRYGFLVAFSPLLLAGAVIGASGFTLKSLSPRFGKMISQLASKEGHLRFIHSRVITHGEEIAFYGGHEVEADQLKQAYGAVAAQTEKLDQKRLWFVVVEQFLMKYVWAAAGMVMIAGPQLLTDKSGDAADRAQNFTVSQGLLTSGQDAVERIMSSYKEVMELAGYTQRVTDLIQVLDDMPAGKFQKALCSSNYESNTSLKANTIVDNQPYIWVKDLPIVTPSGDCLLPSMSIDFVPGQHVLITGPNGCGKSSLFRIISGLWPVHGGQLGKVARSNTFYIPQRPYLTLGDLRSQVIYPDTIHEMKKKKVTDEGLREILQHAELLHVVERVGGLSAVSEWSDVLSGGEKQRLGMARLYYHKPQYALLDECTSAVSIDVEGSMYQYAKDLGITLLTITHRPTLWKFHSHILKFDGQGGHVLEELDASKQLTFKEEKESILDQVAHLEGLQERLQELNTILGE